MKNTITATVLAFGALALTAVARADAPTGDYVESRTASVFAGPCHYSGEYVSDGRAAAMAWHFSKGDWRGVPLAGLSALAVVSADRNLAEKDGLHTTRLYLDARATPAQRKALAAMLTAKCAGAFGTVETVAAAPIAFTRRADGGYRVSAPGLATLEINALPDRACCKQPSLVWYQPLSPTQNRRVGYTQMASVTEKTGDAWARSAENGSFYGTFTF